MDIFNGIMKTIFRVKGKEPEKQEAEKQAEPQVPAQPQKDEKVEQILTNLDECIEKIKDESSEKMTDEERESCIRLLTQMKLIMSGVASNDRNEALMDMIDGLTAGYLYPLMRNPDKAEYDVDMKEIMDAMGLLGESSKRAMQVAVLKLDILTHKANNIVNEIKWYTLEAQLKETDAQLEALLSDVDDVEQLQEDKRGSYRNLMYTRNATKTSMDALKMQIELNNTSITTLRTDITTIDMLPNAETLRRVKERVKKLREEMPNMNDLAVMLKEASDEAQMDVETHNIEISTVKTTIMEHGMSMPLETDENVAAILMKNRKLKEEKAAAEAKLAAEKAAAEAKLAAEKAAAEKIAENAVTEAEKTSEVNVDMQ